MQDDLDWRLSSLLGSHESRSHLHQTNPCFFHCVLNDVGWCFQVCRFLVFLQVIWGGFFNARRYDQLSLQVSSKSCFDFLPAQTADVEILYVISFLVMYGCELLFELATGETVVSAGLLNGNHSREKDVFQIPLAYKYTVMKIPMFGPRMLANCF